MLNKLFGSPTTGSPSRRQSSSPSPLPPVTQMTSPSCQQCERSLQKIKDLERQVSDLQLQISVLEATNADISGQYKQIIRSKDDELQSIQQRMTKNDSSSVNNIFNNRDTIVSSLLSNKVSTIGILDSEAELQRLNQAIAARDKSNLELMERNEHLQSKLLIKQHSSITSEWNPLSAIKMSSSSNITFEPPILTPYESVVVPRLFGPNSVADSLLRRWDGVVDMLKDMTDVARNRSSMFDVADDATCPLSLPTSKIVLTGKTPVIQNNTTCTTEILTKASEALATVWNNNNNNTSTVDVSMLDPTKGENTTDKNSLTNASILAQLRLIKTWLDRSDVMQHELETTVAELTSDRNCMKEMVSYLSHDCNSIKQRVHNVIDDLCRAFSHTATADHGHVSGHSTHVDVSVVLSSIRKLMDANATASTSFSNDLLRQVSQLKSANEALQIRINDMRETISHFKSRERQLEITRSELIRSETFQKDNAFLRRKLGIVNVDIIAPTSQDNDPFDSPKPQPLDLDRNIFSESNINIKDSFVLDKSPQFTSMSGAVSVLEQEIGSLQNVIGQLLQSDTLTEEHRLSAMSALKQTELLLKEMPKISDRRFPLTHRNYSWDVSNVSKDLSKHSSSPIDVSIVSGSDNDLSSMTTIKDSMKKQLNYYQMYVISLKEELLHQEESASLVVAEVLGQLESANSRISVLKEEINILREELRCTNQELDQAKRSGSGSAPRQRRSSLRNMEFGDDKLSLLTSESNDEVARLKVLVETAVTDVRRVSFERDRLKLDVQKLTHSLSSIAAEGLSTPSSVVSVESLPLESEVSDAKIDNDINDLTTKLRENEDALLKLQRDNQRLVVGNQILSSKLVKLENRIKNLTSSIDVNDPVNVLADKTDEWAAKEQDMTKLIQYLNNEITKLKSNSTQLLAEKNQLKHQVVAEKSKSCDKCASLLLELNLARAEVSQFSQKCEDFSDENDRISQMLSDAMEHGGTSLNSSESQIGSDEILVSKLHSKDQQLLFLTDCLREIIIQLDDVEIDMEIPGGGIFRLPVPRVCHSSFIPLALSSNFLNAIRSSDTHITNPRVKEELSLIATERQTVLDADLTKCVQVLQSRIWGTIDSFQFLETAAGKSCTRSAVLENEIKNMRDNMMKELESTENMMGILANEVDGLRYELQNATEEIKFFKRREQMLTVESQSLQGQAQFHKNFRKRIERELTAVFLYANSHDGYLDKTALETVSENLQSYRQDLAGAYEVNSFHNSITKPKYDDESGSDPMADEYVALFGSYMAIAKNTQSQSTKQELPLAFDTSSYHDDKRATAIMKDFKTVAAKAAAREAIERSRRRKAEESLKECRRSLSSMESVRNILTETNEMLEQSEASVRELTSFIDRIIVNMEESFNASGVLKNECKELKKMNETIVCETQKIRTEYESVIEKSFIAKEDFNGFQQELALIRDHVLLNYCVSLTTSQSESSLESHAAVKSITESYNNLLKENESLKFEFDNVVSSEKQLRLQLTMLQEKYHIALRDLDESKLTDTFASLDIERDRRLTAESKFATVSEALERALESAISTDRNISDANIKIARLENEIQSLEMESIQAVRAATFATETTSRLQERLDSADASIELLKNQLYQCDTKFRQSEKEVESLQAKLSESMLSRNNQYLINQEKNISEQMISNITHEINIVSSKLQDCANRTNTHMKSYSTLLHELHLDHKHMLTEASMIIQRVNALKQISKQLSIQQQQRTDIMEKVLSFGQKLIRNAVSLSISFSEDIINLQNDKLFMSEKRDNALKEVDRLWHVCHAKDMERKAFEESINTDLGHYRDTIALKDRELTNIKATLHDNRSNLEALETKVSWMEQRQRQFKSVLSDIRHASDKLHSSPANGSKDSSATATILMSDQINHLLMCMNSMASQSSSMSKEIETVSDFGDQLSMQVHHILLENERLSSQCIQFENQLLVESSRHVVCVEELLHTQQRLEAAASAGLLLEQGNSELSSDLYKSQCNIRSLESTIYELRKTQDYLQQSLAETSEDYYKERQQNSQLRAPLAPKYPLEMTLEQCHQKIKDLEKSLATTHIYAKDENHRAEEEKLKSLLIAEENARLCQINSANEMMLVQSMIQVSDLEKNLAIARSGQEEYEKKATDAESRLLKVMSDLEYAVQSKVELVNELTDAHNTMATFRLAASEAQNQVKTVERRLRETENRMSLMSISATEAISIHTKDMETIASLREDIQQLCSDRDHLLSDYKNLNVRFDDECNELQKQISLLNSDIQGLRSGGQGLATILSTTRSELEASKSESFVAEQRVSKLLHQISVLDHRQIRMHEENEDLQNQLHHVTSVLNDCEREKDGGIAECIKLRENIIELDQRLQKSQSFISFLTELASKASFLAERVAGHGRNLRALSGESKRMVLISRDVDLSIQRLKASIGNNNTDLSVKGAIMTVFGTNKTVLDLARYGKMESEKLEQLRKEVASQQLLCNEKIHRMELYVRRATERNGELEEIIRSLESRLAEADSKADEYRTEAIIARDSLVSTISEMETLQQCVDKERETQRYTEKLLEEAVKIGESKQSQIQRGLLKLEELQHEQNVENQRRVHDITDKILLNEKTESVKKDDVHKFKIEMLRSLSVTTTTQELTDPLSKSDLIIVEPPSLESEHLSSDPSLSSSAVAPFTAYKRHAARSILDSIVRRRNDRNAIGASTLFL